MNYRERDGVIIIQHEGEITKSEGAPDLENLVKELEFKNSLVAGTKNKVILDMSKVTQVDPFGIGMIVASSMRLLNMEGKLKLLSPSPKFREILFIIKITSLFEVFDNEDEAVKSFK